MNELQEWFDKAWFLYPNDLSHKKKGSKQLALKAAEKIYKKSGIEELNRISKNIEELARYDRKELSKGGKPDRWPHFSTFLNSGYFDREIENIATGNRQSQAVLSPCACGEPGKVKGKCDRCYTKDIGDQSTVPISMLSDRLNQIGLGRIPNESDGAWGRRCRDYARSHFGKLTRIVEREVGSDDEV